MCRVEKVFKMVAAILSQATPNPLRVINAILGHLQWFEMYGIQNRLVHLGTDTLKVIDLINCFVMFPFTIADTKFNNFHFSTALGIPTTIGRLLQTFPHMAHHIHGRQFYYPLKTHFNQNPKLVPYWIQFIQCLIPHLNVHLIQIDRADKSL